VLLGEVVDELLDEDGLADPGTAEQADLAAAGVGGEQVDDLDPRLEHLRGRGQLLHPGRRAVDGPPGLAALQRLALVDRLAEQVEDAAERRAAHGHRDGAARVHDLLAAGQAVRGVHGHRADAVVAQVLLDLADEGRGAARDAGVLGLDGLALHDDRRVDLGELRREHGLDDDALDLLDPARVAPAVAAVAVRLRPGRAVGRGLRVGRRRRLCGDGARLGRARLRGLRGGARLGGRVRGQGIQRAGQESLLLLFGHGLGDSCRVT